LSIKDTFLIAQCRKKISELGYLADNFDIKELTDCLMEDHFNGIIDFIKFSDSHVDRFRNQGSKGFADNLKTILNSLCDYFKSTSTDIAKINSFIVA
jgi:hypothetical protein